MTGSGPVDGFSPADCGPFKPEFTEGARERDVVYSWRNLTAVACSIDVSTWMVRIFDGKSPSVLSTSGGGGLLLFAAA